MRKSYWEKEGEAPTPPQHQFTMSQCAKVRLHCSNSYSLEEELAVLAQKAISEGTDVTPAGAL